ncbi:MAG: histidine ammonia-lyase [Longimicrobiales bacterium]
MTDRLEIDGRSLTLEDVERVAAANATDSRAGAPLTHVAISRDAKQRMAASRRVVDDAIAQGRVVYGITTGFGALADVVIPPDRVRELQINLLRSHAAGVGPPLGTADVRAITLLRANVLAAGCSGVRPVVADRLIDLLNNDVIAVIPARGSVGASGDLAPLAHLGLVLVGEGEACHGGERMPGGEALHRAGLDALTLEAKEGIALINGTQVHTGIGTLALLAAERALDTAEVAGAMSLEALRGTPEAFDEAIQRVRPQPGQVTSARLLRALLEGSEIRESHRYGDPRVQDAYSIRCMPQVHGAARQGLAYVRAVLETEVNSVTDNPLIFPEDGRILSGGNFHGQPVAQALDLAAIVCADVASISERRIARLVDPALSGLPAFLTEDPGVNSGLMMAQIVAAALVADIRLRAIPASVDNIPTDANREDHVSMGVGAALKLREAVELLETVLALELITAAQGLEFLKPLTPGAGVALAFGRVRERVARWGRDRELGPDIRAVEMLVRAGTFAEICRASADAAE